MAEQASQRSQASSNLASTNIISGRSAELIGGGIGSAIAALASQDASNQVQMANANSAQIMTQIAGMDKRLKAAAARNLKGVDLSGIIDVIWKEFQAMSKLQKFLILLAASVVVGATTYYCWNRIGGNWDVIKNAANKIMVDMKAKAENMLENLDMNEVLEELQNVIVNRVPNPTTLNSDNIRDLMNVACTLGYGGLIGVLISEMQKF